MIKFILSNGFNLMEQNMSLILKNEYNNLFWGIQAQIPFSIFKGKVNNNFKEIFFSYDNIQDVLKSYNEISSNMTLFDFGNLLLEKTDYENTYGEVIFEEYANKKNVYFEIADIDFIDFLINKYPSIQIILHENYTIFHDNKNIEEIINKYSKNIKAINITILHLCENINIPKIGILNLDSCYYCPQFPLCLNKECTNILRYRQASMFNECLKKKMISIENIVENLSQLLHITDIILFEEIPGFQEDNYLHLIETILQKEKEVTKI